MDLIIILEREQLYFHQQPGSPVNEVRSILAKDSLQGSAELICTNEHVVGGRTRLRICWHFSILPLVRLRPAKARVSHIVFLCCPNVERAGVSQAPFKLPKNVENLELFD